MNVTQQDLARAIIRSTNCCARHMARCRLRPVGPVAAPWPEWPEPAKLSLKEVLRIGRRRKRKRIFAVSRRGRGGSFVGGRGDLDGAGPARQVFSEVAETAAGKALAPQSVSPAGDNPKSVSQPLPPREVRLRVILEQIREKTAADDAKLNRIIARRITEPAGDFAELVQPLLARRADIRAAAAGALQHVPWRARIGGDRIAGLFRQRNFAAAALAQRLKPSTHAAAVHALLNLADSEVLAQLERQESGCRLAARDYGGLEVARRQTNHSFDTDF